ncbi:MAG: GIY-YIG nuclease family protein [Methylococcaceae bacterium]|nr:GIY-YIG nuclease family protein [Methylococcaceae bacterium]
MQEKLNEPISDWIVYMVECDDQSLYTGITNNLTKRFKQHCSARGAKYFYSRKPVKIVYAEAGFNRSSASKREFAIKRMERTEKLALIKTELNKIASLL